MNIEKDALEYLVSIGKKEEKVIDVNGRKYANTALQAVKDPVPERIMMGTLQGLVDFVNNVDHGLGDIFIHVLGPDAVSIVGKLTENFLDRPTFATAIYPSRPNYSWVPIEEFIIHLMTSFVQNDERNSLIKLLSSLRSESSLTLADDGISQQVEAKSGIAKIENVVVPNPAILKPFRTFHEVEQPSSPFVFRLRKSDSGGITCSLFLADNEGWKIEAVDRIKTWLKDKGKVKVPVIG